MAIRKIAQMGHPILRQRAKPVADPTALAVKYLVRDMVDTMIEAAGAGLAAPQIHESLRVVIFHAPEDRAEGESAENPASAEDSQDRTAPLTVLINPEIDHLSPHQVDGWEGCLSVEGLRGLVPRSDHIRYRGYDLEGRLIEREARGFHARVVQHECDHLDGILYPERMRDLSMLVFTSELRHGLPQPRERSES